MAPFYFNPSLDVSWIYLQLGPSKLFEGDAEIVGMRGSGFETDFMTYELREVGGKGRRLSVCVIADSSDSKHIVFSVEIGKIVLDQCHFFSGKAVFLQDEPVGANGPRRVPATLMAFPVRRERIMLHEDQKYDERWCLEASWIGPHDPPLVTRCRRFGRTERMPLSRFVDEEDTWRTLSNDPKRAPMFRFYLERGRERVFLTERRTSDWEDLEWPMRHWTGVVGPDRPGSMRMIAVPNEQAEART